MSPDTRSALKVLFWMAVASSIGSVIVAASSGRSTGEIAGLLLVGRVAAMVAFGVGVVLFAVPYLRGAVESAKASASGLRISGAAVKFLAAAVLGSVVALAFGYAAFIAGRPPGYGNSFGQWLLADLYVAGASVLPDSVLWGLGGAVAGGALNFIFSKRTS